MAVLQSCGSTCERVKSRDRVRKRRVLVVDDNEDLAITSSWLLELQGHEVAVAFDGREALEVARDIAKKDPRVIRAAKEALNGIDTQQVHRSYRFEQGFTFELNLLGASDEAREEFLNGR